MKEIGEKLKEARENIGISIDEAAEDLKVEISQIESVEDGNVEAFSDILNLKYFISDYSKYLGLDKDEMVDEFNEYLFDYTSKLSIEDIKKEVKIEKEKGNKIQSPYTIERVFQYITYGALIILLLIVVYLIYKVATGDDDNNTDNNVVIGGYHELTK